MNDITFNGPVSPETSNFTPIGYGDDFEGASFEGVFDGNNCTISNIIVNTPSAIGVGLFGFIYNAQIVNVTLENCTFTGNTNVGAIAGSSAGNGGGIYNCHVIGGTVTSITDDEENAPAIYAGGIIGYCGDMNVELCTSSATVTGSECVGGIAGLLYEGTLTDCFYTGSSDFSGETQGKIAGDRGGYDDNNNLVAGTEGTIQLALLDDDSEANISNEVRLSLYNGIENVDVTLSGRTLYKDGKWNTLCLPFSLNSFIGTPLDGATVKTLGSTSFDDGLLELTFVDATTIEAGKPYIFRASGSNIEGPTFKGVTISKATTPVEKDYVDFVGTFSPIDIFTEEKTNLYLGADNLLYYPSGEDMTSFTINSFRSYFQLKDGLTAGELSTTEGQEGQNINAFVLNFGEETGIREISKESRSQGVASHWFTLDGRRLNGQPTQQGIFIRSGKKVILP